MSETTLEECMEWAAECANARGGSNDPIRRLFRNKNGALAVEAYNTIEDIQPATLRQLFYQLVSRGALPSTDKVHYDRLGRILTRMREIDIVPRTWIVDHIRMTLKPSSWSGLADFAETVQDAYRKDLWARQGEYVEVLCEKDAIAGTLQPTTNAYDVPLRVCRGYASVSFAGEIADQWAEIEKPIFAYYIGDHDPSGMDLERDLRERIYRYCGRDFEWIRLAVVPEDFEEFNLLRLAVKKSDTRAKAFLKAHGPYGAEVDALPPDVLRARVEEAIQSHIDAEEWNRLRLVEEAEQETLRQFTERLREGESESSFDSDADQQGGAE